jgi:hypothetical protein
VEDMGLYPVSLNALLQGNYCSDRDYTNKVACVAASETWQAEDVFNPVTKHGWRGSYLQESTIITIHNLADATRKFTSSSFVSPAIVGADPDVTPPIKGDLGVLDSFSHGSAVLPLKPARRPIIIQIPPVPTATPPIPPYEYIRLVSAGQDGILQTAISVHPVPATGTTGRGDDLILYLKISDPTSILPKDDQTGCSLTDE